MNWAVEESLGWETGEKRMIMVRQDDGVVGSAWRPVVVPATVEVTLPVTRPFSVENSSPFVLDRIRTYIYNIVPSLYSTGTGCAARYEEYLVDVKKTPS